MSLTLVRICSLTFHISSSDNDMIPKHDCPHALESRGQRRKRRLSLFRQLRPGWDKGSFAKLALRERQLVACRSTADARKLELNGNLWWYYHHV